MSLGENIKKTRTSKNITQKELAEKLDISVRAIQNYESDVRQPRLEIIKKIATALEVDISNLISSSNFNLVNVESLMKKSVDDLMELLIAVNVYTNHTVMFDYMGHVDMLVVRYFENDWVPDVKPNRIDRIYLDDESFQEQINDLYNHYYEILNKDHIAGYDEECGF